ncbi:hypothetical protein IGI04_035155, partial [Brassica rapa subsp. trilocularis]
MLDVKVGCTKQEASVLNIDTEANVVSTRISLSLQQQRFLCNFITNNELAYAYTDSTHWDVKIKFLVTLLHESIVCHTNKQVLTMFSVGFLKIN